MNTEFWDPQAWPCEWIIPHVAPRGHGLITVFEPALPTDYDPEINELPRMWRLGCFAIQLEEIYRHSHSRSFVVPNEWTAPDQLLDRMATIIAIAEVCPTIVLADADMPEVTKRFLSVSRAGLTLGHNSMIAHVICGEEPGWTISLSPDHLRWSLVHPYPPRIVQPKPKRPFHLNANLPVSAAVPMRRRTVTTDPADKRTNDDCIETGGRN